MDEDCLKQEPGQTGFTWRTHMCELEITTIMEITHGGLLFKETTTALSHSNCNQSTCAVLQTSAVLCTWNYLEERQRE